MRTQKQNEEWNNACDIIFQNVKKTAEQHMEGIVSRGSSSYSSACPVALSFALIYEAIQGAQAERITKEDINSMIRLAFKTVTEEGEKRGVHWHEHEQKKENS